MVGQDLKIGRKVPQQNSEPVSPGEILAVIYGQGLGDKRFGFPAELDEASIHAALNAEPRLKHAVYKHVRRVAAVPPEPKPSTGAATRWAAGLLVMGGLLLLASAMVPRLTWPDAAPIIGMAETSSPALAGLRALAVAGDPAAAKGMGDLYDSHWLTAETSVSKNDAEAFKWYLRAARAGDIGAANNAAYDYQNGHGTAPDMFFAAQWYRAAADGGMASAQTALGYFYQNGVAVAQNPTNAALWFMRSAAQGDAAGENALGFAYYNGSGVDHDVYQALHWFQAAAAQKFGPAMLNLGLLYLQGAGATPDPVAAAKWFVLAGMHGDAQSAQALATVAPSLTPDQMTAAHAAAQVWDAEHP
jgi:TPR repeat protein